MVIISQPSRLRSLIVSRAQWAYSWLCLLNCSVSGAAWLSTKMIAVARGAVFFFFFFVYSLLACDL